MMFSVENFSQFYIINMLLILVSVLTVIDSDWNCILQSSLTDSSLKAFQNSMNQFFDNVFVSLSVTCALILIYCRSIFSSATFSCTKWCCISICFVLAWNWEFFARVIIFWLSQNMIVVWELESSELSCFSNHWSYITFFVICVWSMYSVLHVNKVTVSCCFENQLITSLLMLKMKSEIDLWEL